MSYCHHDCDKLNQGKVSTIGADPALPPSPHWNWDFLKWNFDYFFFTKSTPNFVSHASGHLAFISIDLLPPPTTEILDLPLWFMKCQSLLSAILFFRVQMYIFPKFSSQEQWERNRLRCYHSRCILHLVNAKVKLGCC